MILSTPAKLKVAFGGMETLKPFLCWEGTVGAEPGGRAGVLGSEGSVRRLGFNTTPAQWFTLRAPSAASLNGREERSGFFCGRNTAKGCTSPLETFQELSSQRNPFSRNGGRCLFISPKPEAVFRAWLGDSDDTGKAPS